jgi:hypothetical protein
MNGARSTSGFFRRSWATWGAIALGGMLTTLATLWLQAVLGQEMAGGLLTPGEEAQDLATIFLLPTMSVPWAVIGSRAVRRWEVSRTPANGLGLRLAVVWIGGYFLLWWVSLFTGPLNGAEFVGAWVVAGWLAEPKVLSSEGSAPPDHPPGSVHRTVARSQPGSHHSFRIEPDAGGAHHGPTRAFGRIPQATVHRIGALASQAASLPVGVLPDWAPVELRRWTIRTVLETMLIHHPAGSHGLPSDEVHELRSLIQLAASLARESFDVEGQAVYRGALVALLGRWKKRVSPPKL